MTAETLLKELGQKIAKLTNSEGECVWCGFVFNNNLHAFDCPAASLLELPEGEPLDDSYSIRRTRKGNIADAILPLFVELLAEARLEGAEEVKTAVEHVMGREGSYSDLDIAIDDVLAALAASGQKNNT